MRYDMIAPGKYLATATGSALSVTKTGKEQIVVGFDVHVTDPETGQPCSVPMTWYGFFTEATIVSTDKALAALGFDPSTRDISELNPDTPESSPIVGAEVEVVLAFEDDGQGGERLKIRWVNRRGGGLALKDRMEPKQAKAFGAEMRRRLLAARGPGQASPPPAAPQRGPAAQPQRLPPAKTPGPARTPAGSAPRQPAAEPPPFDDIPF